MSVERIDLAPGYSISRIVKGGWQLAGGHGSVDDATAICAAKRSPTRLRYGVCPVPCDDIVIKTCSTGPPNPCSTDADCDTAPGAGDGRCGSWQQTADCLVCQTENALTSAFDRTYGTLSPPFDDADADCMSSIGKSLATLISTRSSASRSAGRASPTGSTVRSAK